MEDVDAYLILYLLGLYSSTVFINASTNTESEGSLSNYVEDHAGMIALIALIITIIIFIAERGLEWQLRASPHCGRVYKEKVRAKKKLNFSFSP